MGNSKISVGAAVLLLAVATAVLPGCGNNDRPAPTAQNARVKVQDTATDRGGTNNNNSGGTASRLESLARGVNGVSDANCVVFGRYAIVGIDVDPTMERSRVGTTKYAVAKAFRRDPAGINALVTADLDMAQRIREIRADVRDGRPLAGFANELADMVGRLVPQMPRSIVPPASPENFGTTDAQNGRR